MRKRFISLVALILLLCQTAFAANISLDLETASYSDLLEAQSLIAARIEAAYEEELASYQILESAEDISVSVDAPIAITATAIRVAEGPADVQALMQLPDESRMVVYYVPTDACPMMHQGSTYTVRGLYSGDVNIADETLPSMTVNMLETAMASHAGMSQIAFDDASTDFPAVGYTFSISIYNYLGLVVHNNTNETVELEASVIFKDASGGMVGAKNTSVRAFEGGCDMLLTFTCDTPFETYEYEITTNKESYYLPVLSQITHEVTLSGDKAIIAATNSGDLVAEFVQAHVLFMDGDEAVYYQSFYMTDGDSELRPGKTQLHEFRAYGTEFDAVQVYFEGRASKK